MRVVEWKGVGLGFFHFDGVLDIWMGFVLGYWKKDCD